MHLRDTGTRPGLALHDPHALSAREAHAKHLLDALPKVFANDGLDVPPVVLRRIVKHAAKHLLELWRQHGALHRNGLSYLQVQAAIGPKQVEQALRIPRVQLRHRAGSDGLGPEVELVVKGDHERRREGAQRAGKARGVDLAVRDVDGTAGGEGHEQPPRPSPALSVLLRGSWSPELFGRRRSKRLEGAGALDGSAAAGGDEAMRAGDVMAEEGRVRHPAPRGYPRWAARYAVSKHGWGETVC